MFAYSLCCSFPQVKMQKSRAEIVYNLLYFPISQLGWYWLATWGHSNKESKAGDSGICIFKVTWSYSYWFEASIQGVHWCNTSIESKHNMIWTKVFKWFLKTKCSGGERIQTTQSHTTAFKYSSKEGECKELFIDNFKRNKLLGICCLHQISRHQSLLCILLLLKATIRHVKTKQRTNVFIKLAL